MIHAAWSRGSRSSGVEPPIELRFVDLFMILVTTLIFITVILSIVSAFVGRGEKSEVSPPLRIVTRGLPAALQGRPFEVALAASGGGQGYRWEMAGGRLPAGLGLTAEGLIAGTPGQVEATEALVRVHDGNGGADERRLPLRVEPADGAQGSERRARPQIVAPRILLPDARGETAYQFELRMNGGSPPFRWQLAGGKLPRGLRLSPDGAVLGVPQEKEGISDFSVRVADAARRQWTQPLAMRIAPAPPSLTWKILKWAFWIWLVVSFVGSLPMIWKGGGFIGLEQIIEQLFKGGASGS